MQTRYANIDLLRTIAIAMVVFYHAVNMSKVPLWVWKIAETGSLGVDLFFVLSGFLIGSLYFKEQETFGNVSISRFIGRRIFRTVPMYLIFMPLAFLPVYFIKKTPFEWQYLFFLQNYMTEMPYYVISWSLCVEEHFYLILPFFLPLFFSKKTRGVYFLIPVLLFLPMLLRILNLNTPLNENALGYYHTATHFRYEGLLLGVLLAATAHYKRDFLTKLLPFKKAFFISTPLLVLSMAFVPEYVRHSLYYTFVAIFFTFSLAILYIHKPLKIALLRFNHPLAISSYSTYLVHSIVIHIWVKIFGKLGIASPFLTAPVMFLSAFLVGYMVYYFIEKKLMYWRDIYLPARKRESPPLSISTLILNRFL